MLIWANRAVQAVAVVAIGWHMVARLRGDDVPTSVFLALFGLVALASGLQLLVARHALGDRRQ